ncbi:FAD-dependent oxidoreductase, partial [Streptococcus pneumoniae]|nr:FAD-dependent oxidoreductase [Streptococcus pneumoniae]
MAASAGSFSHLVDENFILDKRVVGGMQQVSIRMAAALGDDVILAAPVRTVRWNSDGATVFADGDIEVH